MAVYSISVTDTGESFTAFITKIPGMEQDEFTSDYEGQTDRDAALSDLMQDIEGFMQTNP